MLKVAKKYGTRLEVRSVTNNKSKSQTQSHRMPKNKSQCQDSGRDERHSRKTTHPRAQAKAQLQMQQLHRHEECRRMWKPARMLPEGRRVQEVNLGFCSSNQLECFQKCIWKTVNKGGVTRYNCLTWQHLVSNIRQLRDWLVQ